MSTNGSKHTTASNPTDFDATKRAAFVDAVASEGAGGAGGADSVVGAGSGAGGAAGEITGKTSPFANPRAALAAGTDVADDLTALELALTAAIEEEDPIDPERRQAALRAIARHLAAHATRLHDIFAYLWQHPEGA